MTVVAGSNGWKSALEHRPQVWALCGDSFYPWATFLSSCEVSNLYKLHTSCKHSLASVTVEVTCGTDECRHHLSLLCGLMCMERSVLKGTEDCTMCQNTFKMPHAPSLWFTAEIPSALMRTDIVSFQLQMHSLINTQMGYISCMNQLGMSKAMPTQRSVSEVRACT